MRAQALAWLSAPLLPLAAATVAFHPRLRADAAARLCLRLPPVGPGVIWLHAASAGELRGALALARRLPGEVLLTVDSDAGLALGRGAAGVTVWPLPLDHPVTLGPLWARARPRAVVFVEGAFWPQLAGLAAREGAPILRVSAKAGPRTRRLAAWGLRVPLLDLVREAAARAPGEPGDWVGGDPKLAAAAPVPLGWARPYLVGASTREGDEDALIDALPTLPEPLGLVLAPREPRRFPEVAARLHARGLRWARRSAGPPGEARVLLLDSFGELDGVVAGARVAFIGGTFDPSLGGHSPAAAVAAGVPVVAGPHRWANAHSYANLHAVSEPPELPDALLRALAAPRLAPAETDLGTLAAWVADRLGPTAPERAARPWLAPLSAAAGLLGRGRQRVRALRPWTPPVPVWAVGSPMARGPGRTRVTRAFAALARAEGLRVGVACRGYRRPVADRLGESALGDDWRRLGDEGALHARDGSLVAAGPDWSACVAALVTRGCDFVLLDDGLDALEVVAARRWWVVDAAAPTGGAALPSGEARWRRVPDQADGVVLFGAGWSPPRGLPVVQAEREVGPWMRGDAVIEAPSDPIAIFAAVSRPEAVGRSWGRPDARLRVLPDHAPLDEAILNELAAWADGLPLFCTAKDQVRLPAPWGDRVGWRDATARLINPPRCGTPA